MDENEKQASSFQLDQEILDARGIGMTVEEVAGLPTCKYAERIQSLKLAGDDLAFLKGLRRRIKNRLASQNSRRRSVEHLRRLARELRAVRECRDDALSERRALVTLRGQAREKCQRLRDHVMQVLRARGDTTEVPKINVARTHESQINTPKETIKKISVVETKSPLLSECFMAKEKVSDKAESEPPAEDIIDNPKEKVKKKTIDRKVDKNLFECSLDRLVNKSLNHIYKEERDKKKVYAKTVFITNDKIKSSIESMVLSQTELEEDFKREMSDDGVLNLSVKRKGHGRKQLAPRRIAYHCFNNDEVLDLKVKKETQ